MQDMAEDGPIQQLTTTKAAGGRGATTMPPKASKPRQKKVVSTLTLMRQELARKSTALEKEKAEHAATKAAFKVAQRAAKLAKVGQVHRLRKALEATQSELHESRRIVVVLQAQLQHRAQVLRKGLKRKQVEVMDEEEVAAPRRYLSM